MYGTRDAAANWEDEYSEYLVGHGYDKGLASPCHFHHKQTRVRILVHGDDFMAVGKERDLRELVCVITNKYEARWEIIGPGEHLPSTTKIIGRHIRFVNDGIELEVDG
eukprot:593734-Karenia_brevis.AAC.1